MTDKDWLVKKLESIREQLADICEAVQQEEEPECEPDIVTLDGEYCHPTCPFLVDRDDRKYHCIEFLTKLDRIDVYDGGNFDRWHVKRCEDCLKTDEGESE